MLLAMLHRRNEIRSAHHVARNTLGGRKYFPEGTPCAGRAG